MTLPFSGRTALNIHIKNAFYLGDFPNINFPHILLYSMSIQNDILSHMYIYCMGYETCKTQQSTHQKRLKKIMKSTPQLVKKSCMQIRKVNKGCELFAHNYDKSKKSVYLTVERFLLYCALHMHDFAYVCVCVCLWGNIINTLTSQIICSRLNQFHIFINVCKSLLLLFNYYYY